MRLTINLEPDLYTVAVSLAKAEDCSISASSADGVSALYRTTYSVVHVLFPRMILLQPAVDHDALYKIARAERVGAGG